MASKRGVTGFLQRLVDIDHFDENAEGNTDDHFCILNSNGYGINFSIKLSKTSD